MFRNLSDGLSRFFLPDSFVYFVSSKKSLYDENQVLKKENEALKAEIQSTLSNEEENNRLKESFGITDSLEYVFGQIIFRGGQKVSQNKIAVRVSGEVKVGENVYFKNIPIGKVEEVRAGLATVLLLSSPTNTFSVLVGSPAFESQARGLGGGSFEIFVPKGVEVAVGDTVGIPSFGNSSFSKISDISSDSADAFQRVLFTFPFNLNYMDFVSIKKTSE